MDNGDGRGYAAPDVAGVTVIERLPIARIRDAGEQFRLVPLRVPPSDPWMINHVTSG